jgi:beta-glucuronidase
MKKLIASTGLFFCLSFLLLSQSGVDLIQNVYNRDYQSLNGKWHAILDQYGAGYYHNMTHKPFHKIKDKPWLFYRGLFHNKKAEDKTDRVEYNFDISPTLEVPRDWNSQRDELLYFDGSIWYKTEFDYTKNNKRLFLYFGAANYEANVFMNKKVIGDHIGGYTPFNFEITDKVVEGNNNLIVRVDNRKGKNTVPAIFKDWWNYGGLTRDVKLIALPQTFIKDYYVQLDGNPEKIKVWVQLDGKNYPDNANISISGLGIDQNIALDKNGYGETIITKKGIDLWEPGNPNLYDVVIKAGEDQIKDQIGFRTIEAVGQQIHINGEPVFLKGISMHEEIPTRPSRAYLKEDAEYMLNFVKELNGNYARLAHYPHNEHIVRMADKMGIFLWTEVPVYHGIAYGNEETYQNAQKQLTEMITRDKNRASIIIWSVANETPPKNPDRLPFLKRLIDHAKKMDTERLISAAVHIDFTHNIKNLMRVNDPLTEFVDVISVNTYAGWYGKGLPDVARKKKWEIKYKKPFHVSETGAGALAGFHADSLTRWSEEYQEWYYKEQVNMLSKIPELCGMTPWILFDFTSPNRRHPIYQGLYNRKGLVSDNGQRKKAFYVLQKFYKEYKKEWK